MELLLLEFSGTWIKGVQYRAYIPSDGCVSPLVQVLCKIHSVARLEFIIQGSFLIFSDTFSNHVPIFREPLLLVAYDQGFRSTTFQMSDIHNREVLQEHLRNLPSSAHVDITIIPAGNVTLPDYTIHANGTEEVITLPDYVFLIEHQGLGKKAFFDLGVANVYLHINAN